MLPDIRVERIEEPVDGHAAAEDDAVSSTTGAGIDAWIEWLSELRGTQKRRRNLIIITTTEASHS